MHTFIYCNVFIILMGNVVCCKSRELSTTNMENARTEQQQNKAVNYIRTIYKKFKEIWGMNDIPFLEQTSTLKMNNQTVIDRIAQFEIFKYNRILSKVPSELRKPTEVTNHAIYSGYW